MSRFTVIAYHTTDDYYTKQADRLLASLCRFNLPYTVEKIEPSAWKEAVNTKPTFIARMMELYPDRDLLYVDADAEFRQHPTLFDAPYPFDVGIFDRPLPDHPHAATLYFTPTDEARWFVRRWEELQQEAPQWMDQRNLRRALDEMRPDSVSVGQLPHAYCCKVEKADASTVIVQHQASRGVAKRT